MKKQRLQEHVIGEMGEMMRESVWPIDSGGRGVHAGRGANHPSWQPSETCASGTARRIGPAAWGIVRVHVAWPCAALAGGRGAARWRFGKQQRAGVSGSAIVNGTRLRRFRKNPHTHFARGISACDGLRVHGGWVFPARCWRGMVAASRQCVGIRLRAWVARPCTMPLVIV